MLLIVLLIAGYQAYVESQKSTADTSIEAKVEKPGAPIPATGITGRLPLLPPQPGRLDVYFLDVTLGDAIFIRLPTGEGVVIDGGESPTELSSYLDMLGVKTVDLVIASHPHSDHVTGLVNVIEQRKPKDVWTNGQPYTTQLYRELEEAIKQSGATEHFGKPGDTFSVGGVNFTVDGPSKKRSNVNDDSLVIRMDCGPSSFLFAGDAESGEENDMIAGKKDLHADILKLGHHGSRSSTSSQMIFATTPRLAVYEARAGNPYGHPHQETLDRLAEANVPVDGTKDAGQSVVVSTMCDDQFEVTPKFGAFATVGTP